MHSSRGSVCSYLAGLAVPCLASLFVLVASPAAGQTGWQTQALPALPGTDTFSLSAVKARGATEAWIAGGVSNDDAALLKTLDGSTWSLVFRKGSDADPWVSFSSSSFVSLSVVDANTAWTAGLWGGTAYTADGGTTWRKDASACATPPAPGGTAAHGYGVKAVTATNVWVSGWDPWDQAGQVWHRPYSGDCASWGYWPYRLEAQTGYSNIYGFDAADASNAWAVSSDTFHGGSWILHTTNAGDTWSQAASPGGMYAFDVAAVSPSVAWVVGQGGLIAKTTDGGATWVMQGSGVAATLWKVAAVNANVAWAVGDNGTIVKTTDGGATWRSQVSGVTDADPPVNLTGIAAADANTAWAIGGQVVLHVTDGGTYYPLSAPKLNALSPAGVPAAGSATPISVYGQDFRPGARVYFGTTPAASVEFLGPAVLAVTAPAHAAGLVDVRVVNPDGQSDTVPNAFAFGGTMPVVVGVHPSWGYLNTQVEVDLLGAGFTPDELATDPVPTVNVNGTPVAGTYAAYNDVHVVFSPGLLQTAGLVTVTVTTAAGTSNAVTFAVNYGSVSVDRPTTAPYDKTVAVQSLSGPMSATFYGLTSSGWVKVGKIFERPYWLADETGPPAGYTLLPTYYYEVTTYSSMHYAAATFCIPYADADISAAGLDESRLTLVSYTEPDGGRAWADITYSLDTAANVICGTGTSISYLALAQGTVPGPAPQATAIAPAIAPPTGGATFTITGGLFRPGATVTFGGVAAANATVVNGMKITGTVPAHALGLVDVVITNPDSQAATMTAGFEYVTAPTVTSVTPPRGRQSGYTSVTIAGTGFRPGLTVRFGGTLMGSYSLVDDQTITGTTPSHAAGVVDVLVTNVDGQAGTLAGGYTYMPPPTVTGISPSAGPVSGGTPVTITGTGFETGAIATIGCAAATQVAVVSATSITAVTPACQAGTAAVTVYNPDGSSGTRFSSFTFGTAPRADTIRPNIGSIAGGTVVTISGVNFQNGATVTLGGAPATDVTVLGSTAIRATTSAHAAGSVFVVVVNPDAQNWSMSFAFTYLAPPAFTDDPLQARTTTVKLVHLTELRQRIAQLRSAYGLAAATWTDAAPTARATVINAVHLTEMRAAIDDVFVAAGRTPPSYTAAPVERTTAVAAVHIAELRAAVLGIW
jgi:photosystem II stability/assembly factor-like uncharacterized protein